MSAAKSAITEATKEKIVIASVSQFSGLNSVAAPNVMWGVKIISDQSTMYASFFTHMDKDQGKIGSEAPQQITKTLYDKMGEKEDRSA